MQPSICIVCAHAFFIFLFFLFLQKETNQDLRNEIFPSALRGRASEAIRWDCVVLRARPSEPLHPIPRPPTPSPTPTLQPERVGTVESEQEDVDAAWLPAGVITEHDGSITAVIRHQTKGTSRMGRSRGRRRRRKGGRGRGDRMVLFVTAAPSRGLFLMKCQPRSAAGGRGQRECSGGGSFRW